MDYKRTVSSILFIFFHIYVCKAETRRYWFYRAIRSVPYRRCSKNNHKWTFCHKTTSFRRWSDGLIRRSAWFLQLLRVILIDFDTATVNVTRVTESVSGGNYLFLIQGLHHFSTKDGVIKGWVFYLPYICNNWSISNEYNSDWELILVCM